MIFSEIFENFPLFFDRSQKKYFSELKKEVEYSFDVKNRDLSIYDVSRAILALCREFWDRRSFVTAEMTDSLPFKKIGYIDVLKIAIIPQKSLSEKV